MASDDIGRSHGQRVPPITVQITSTLRNYPDGSQILKELLQNADDACASEVEFLLDETQHSTDHLLHPDVAKYQGPALYAWNDAVFGENDWVGIQNISMSMKENEVLKVGRFGLGFISVYHITDFPCILSNEYVLLFDPHKVIDNEGGLIIELNKFATDLRVQGHFESFNTYFGYRGTHPYEGTIFRFPLRTNASDISLPENIYDPDKIRTRLFDPFKQEVENCLLFMKHVCSVKVSVKDCSGTKLLYSAKVDSLFRERLKLYRENMFEFIQNKSHNHSSRIFIAIFPTCFINCDQTKTVRLWLVMNMLGLPDQASRSNSRQFESYLPWFAVALPLPHSQPTLDALLHQNCCWSEEFIDTARFFSFIDHKIPYISLSSEMLNFVGNLFCFLPIAASSNFPFHIHGYFALSTNRRSIKWPRFDDLSDEAKWNKELVEQLGTISYAVLIHLAVSRFRTQGRSMLHYSLWSCLPSDSETDELQSIIHSGALHILRNSKLVCSKLDCTWIKLCKGYYLPSAFGRTIPHEKVCADLLLQLSQSVVELTPEVSNVIRNYQFLERQISELIISPTLIRQMLIRFESDEALINFLLHHQNVYALLEVVLCDLDFSSDNVSAMLEGIQLIPVSNSELPICFGGKTCFISDGSQDFSKIFPGLERYFVKRSLPHPINTSLLSLSRSGRINIKDITNIRSGDARYFVELLQFSMEASFFSLDSPVVWTPGLNSQPDKSWIKQVWKFIDQDKAIIGVLKRHQLPLLPKQDLHTPQIDLLPLSTTTMPYFEHSTTPTHSGIEQLITASDCHICHRHVFILPYHEFVLPHIPRGLLSILKLPIEIQRTFIENIANADISIIKSLINAILSIESMDNDEKNLIKSFPIFLLIGENYSTLDCDTNYCIPHDSIPIELDCFPSFINPCNNLNVRLCWKLGIKSISLDETIQYHLLPLISSNSLSDQPQKRKELSLWILRNSSLLNEDVRKVLSTTKWLLDSNANPNFREQFKLFSPTNLCDPQDVIMSQLMCVDETGIEGIFPNEIYNIDCLKALGLQSSSKLEFSILERNIKKAIENVKKIRDNLKWISALVQLISLYMIEFDLRNRHNFWNNIFKFSKFILSNGSYFKPTESYLCSEHNSCLIENMAPLIVDASDERCNHGDIFRCMGFKTIFPVSLVCEKLKNLVSLVERSNINHQYLFHNVKEIYKYFQQEIFSDINVKREIDLPEKFVYIPEFGFYDTGRVVLSCDDILTPHVFSLEKHYGKMFTPFFTTYNIDREITFCKCQFILEQLRILLGLSPSEVNLALRVVQMSADLIQNESSTAQSLVIAQDCMIYPAGQCVFNDLHWMNRSELATIKPIVHSGVLNTTANKIGCLPASLEMTPTAESISYSFISGAGQSEDLVQRLRGILEGYRVQWDVFSELIQNSDDAGAKQVKILFDYTSHPCSSVLHKNMEGVHGPALYVFNDSTFTAQDFASILKLSSGNKLYDPSKVGRFGVGFNAVYNYTDCPSFVSDRFVHIFDPLRKYIGPLSMESGIKIRFTDDEPAISTFHDQFQVYQDIFDCDILNRNPYKCTLFRLPFRTNRSQLSDNTFNCEAIAELQAFILKEIPNFILFLQNVTSIEVYERCIGNNSINKLVTISKSECPTTHFLQNNRRYFEDYLLKIRENCRPDSVKSVDKISICKDCHEKKCIISYATGVKECFDVLKKFTNSDKTFLPLCGVTIPLESIDNPPRNLGKLYTFLPLTIKSPLPLHINGYFSLSSSRKNLSDVDVSSSEKVTDLRTDWNVAIVNDALSNALICALEALPLLEPLCSSRQAEHYTNYYSLWPVKDNSYIIWKAFPENFARRIVESFPSAKLFSCAHDPSIWLSFDEIAFLSVNQAVNKDFLQFIYTLSHQNGITFAYLPEEFLQTKIYKIFAELKPKKVFDLKKICEGIIFKNVANFPLDKLVIIFNSLIPLCIEDSENWLLNSLCNIAFIPCGSNESEFQLRKPSEVVCPNTKIASLYQRDEMRIPVSELHEQFDLSKLEVISTVLKRMGVIYERLPECEVISRCQITYSLGVEESTRHATTLIEYLSQEDRALFDSIYPQIKSIPFIPTHKDDLFGTLSIPHIQFTSPEKCYTFSCRHLVSPLYPCASKVVSISARFDISSIPSTKIVLECLNTLIYNVDYIKDCDFNIDDKFLEIYKHLSRYETNDPEMDLIGEKLKDEPWIWHPDYKQFYPSNQVILSSEFKTLDENKYIIAFPYTDPLRDLKFKRFLIAVGVKEGIDDNTIIVCLQKIYEEFRGVRLPQNLVQLVLTLISLIDDCESCQDEMPLLSQTEILHSPSELYMNISLRLENKDLNMFVHSKINYITALRLGAKTSEELFSTNIDLNESDFGVEEEITDRIQSLVRDIPMDTLVKELIQNAEDAKATEIVFILDDQDYSRCMETLSLPGEVYPSWKHLHSVPSLSVYNNKGFTEEDFKGIQTLSVGGKAQDRKSIGKFGLGFNSVYQITDAPTFITTQNGQEGLSFCCFDPFIKYTATSFESRSYKEKRGKRIDVKSRNYAQFSDQFFPFKFDKFSENPEIANSLANLWKNSEFTMFRFPLDICCNMENCKIPYSKVESRKQCSLESLKNTLIEQLTNCSEMLLFLNNVQSLKVVSIDKDQKLTLECSHTFQTLDSISRPIPDYFPRINTEDNIKVQIKSCTIWSNFRKSQLEYVVYFFPELDIEYYLSNRPELEQFRGKLCEEKLWGFGAVAVCISDYHPVKKHSLFTFLPFGVDQFPVLINAPLISDASRQHFSNQSSNWGEAWHSSIIKTILVPLYSMLLIDLRDPKLSQPLNCFEAKQEYFEWFYSLFPGESNSLFLANLSRILYSFLYETNQPILLCDNLDMLGEGEEPKWYTLRGPDCGVFKTTCFHENEYTISNTEQINANEDTESKRKECQLRKSLILIQFPLSLAPSRLFNCFKDFKLVKLDQSRLLSYLNNNKHNLFQANTSSYCLNSSMLDFEQFQTILEYILTAGDVFFTRNTIIPLCIDIKNNVGCFRKDTPSFEHQFSPLLPHCSDRFISEGYLPNIVAKMSMRGYVREIECSFLSKHLDVEKFEKPEQYSLFWEFVIKNNLDIEDLKCFSKHKLVPVKSDDIPCTFYPIQDLKYMVSQTLSDVTKYPNLFNALTALGCPLLFFEFFDQYSSSQSRIKSYLDKIAISHIRPGEIILGSLLFSSNLSTELEPDEASLLYNIFSQMNLNQFKLPKNLDIISELKLFQALSGEYLSLNQCDICFMNIESLYLGPEILTILQDGYNLVIFQYHEGNFLNLLFSRLQKELVDVKGLLMRFIFPNFSSLQISEQKNILSFFAQKLAGGRIDQESTDLINVLSEISFICLEDQNYAIKDLYSYECEFFCKFLASNTLPEIWREDHFKHLFNVLGLQNNVTLEYILEVALKFSREEIPFENLPYLLDTLADILNKMTFEQNFDSKIEVLQQIKQVTFLPAWMMADICTNQSPHRLELVRFCDAQLNEFKHCCSAIARIHLHPFKIPQACYQCLGIIEQPDPDLVKEHLIKITRQLMSQMDNISDDVSIFFTSSYDYLELHRNTYTNFNELFDLPCILCQNKLYCPINMLFTSSVDLSPFVIQLPPALAGRCQNFFSRIGVETKANYKHFALVLLSIHHHLQTSNIELKDSRYLQQAETVFNHLINALRDLDSSCTPLDLDPAQIMLLTNDSRLFPSGEVVFGDNPSLLSRINELRLQFKILKPLEPDENKSCVPPLCLKLRKLNELVREEICPSVYHHQIQNGPLANSLRDRLINRTVFTAMRRLYFHLTKKDLEKLLLRNGGTCFDDGQPHPGFVSVSQLLHNLQVISVEQIDLLIIENQQIPPIIHPLTNSCGCYIDGNNQFLISQFYSADTCIYKDIAFAINTYLGNIFTEALSPFELCFMLCPTKLMNKLNQYNIAIDPWTQQSAIHPQRRHVPIPNTPSLTTPVISTDYPMAINTVTCTVPMYGPCLNPENMGITMGEPDIPAAKRWLMVSQCDMYAADHLMTISRGREHLFPAHACFCSFEAVVKAFIALLHYKGSSNRPEFERNLRFYLDHLKFLIPNEDIRNEIERYIIPLMNYDMETRVPSITCTPGMGCYIPQQIFTVDQAIEARINAKLFIQLLVREFPEMNAMVLNGSEAMLRSQPSLNPPIITEILTFDVGTEFKQDRLNPEHDEFRRVSRCFYTSMPYSKIMLIEKIFNPTSWRAFTQNIIRETNIHHQSCLFIRSLFHGSGDTSPDLIIRDTKGFNMEFAQGGLWGKGIYFATNCSYSHKRYRHTTESNACCVFLATVFVGYAKELDQDRNLTEPPTMPNSRHRYHSVQGTREGELIRTVYKNCMAYPSYLITYIP